MNFMGTQVHAPLRHPEWQVLSYSYHPAYLGTHFLTLIRHTAILHLSDTPSSKHPNDFSTLVRPTAMDFIMGTPRCKYPYNPPIPHTPSRPGCSPQHPSQIYSYGFGTSRAPQATDVPVTYVLINLSFVIVSNRHDSGPINNIGHDMLYLGPLSELVPTFNIDPSANHQV